MDKKIKINNFSVDEKLSWKIQLAASTKDFENQEDSIVFNYDIIYMVSQYLSSKDIIRLGLTCKKMFYLITHNHFIKRYHWTNVSIYNKDNSETVNDDHYYYKEILKFGRKPMRYYPLNYNGPFDRCGNRIKNKKVKIDKMDKKNKIID